MYEGGKGADSGRLTPLKVGLSVKDGQVVVSLGAPMAWFSASPEHLRPFFERGVELCNQLRREEETHAAQVNEQSGTDPD